jgi:hypothetical protein
MRMASCQPGGLRDSWDGRDGVREKLMTLTGDSSDDVDVHNGTDE